MGQRRIECASLMGSQALISLEMGFLEPAQIRRAELFIIEVGSGAKEI